MIYCSPFTSDVEAELRRGDLSVLASRTLQHTVFSMGNVPSPYRACRSHSPLVHNTETSSCSTSRLGKQEMLSNAFLSLSPPSPCSSKH